MPRVVACVTTHIKMVVIQYTSEHEQSIVNIWEGAVTCSHWGLNLGAELRTFTYLSEEGT